MIKPWLWLPPYISHHLAPKALPFIAKFTPSQECVWMSMRWKKLKFKNRMGIAGGVDKNAQNIIEWAHLGAGFIEIGTIVPAPQTANPPPILLRHTPSLALWNKMGFPSRGVDYVRSRLEKYPLENLPPIFANIGKNRTTPNESAHHDYISCMEKLHKLIQVFVINISSPNTQGLRQLHDKMTLLRFLDPIINANQKFIEPRKLLLKISPDLNDQTLYDLLQISLDLNIDGWILTNTTSNLKNLGFPEEGGISGKPLAFMSRNMLGKTIKWLGTQRKDKLIISVGGIFSSKDIMERIEIGADLVEVYSAIVFEGPFYFRKMSQKFSKISK